MQLAGNKFWDWFLFPVLLTNRLLYKVLKTGQKEKYFFLLFIGEKCGLIL
jgi:hypothetical protein